MSTKRRQFCITGFHLGFGAKRMTGHFAADEQHKTKRDDAERAHRYSLDLLSEIAAHAPQAKKATMTSRG